MQRYRVNSFSQKIYKVSDDVISSVGDTLFLKFADMVRKSILIILIGRTGMRCNPDKKDLFLDKIGSMIGRWGKKVLY
jgi:hypothetical protein